MMPKQGKQLVFLMIAGFLMLIAPVISKPSEKPLKRPLSHTDYDSWKSIVGPHISSDGGWLLYIATPQDGEADLIVKSLKNPDLMFRHTVGYSGEGTDSEKAAKPQFTFDLTHVLFLISPSQKEIKTAKKDKKKEKLKKRLGILSLQSRAVDVIDRVKSYRIPEKAGGWAAFLKEKEQETKKKKSPIAEEKESEEKKPPSKKEVKAAEQKEKAQKEKKKKFGTALVVRSLKDGRETVFKDVLSFLFTKNGKFLYFIVSSKENPESDGLYMLETETAKKTGILVGKGDYKNIAFDKKQTKMAFLSDKDDYEAEKPTFNLYGCAVGASNANLWISHKSFAGFPKGMAVSDKSKISFSDDGQVMLFGIKEIPESKKEDSAKDKENKAKFDLWHWNDPYPQPQQKLMASRIKNNTWETVYHFNSKKLVKLADEDIPDVELSKDGKIGFARTIKPYTKKVSYDGSYYDIYVIDPETGAKTLVKKELFRRANLSPNGKYIYWFAGKDWHVYDIAKKTEANITKSIPARFDREDWDTPSPSYGYGTAGWTSGDRSILVYDRYDIWEVTPDGSRSRNITEGFGRKNNLSFRYIRTDPEERTIAPQKTMLLRTVNEETMDSGFYSDRVKGEKPPSKLIMGAESFSYPQKAKNADALFFTRSAFNQYPDVWVSDASFQTVEKVTDLGKQMEPFLWGTSELLNFESSDGKPLKGILIKPETFDPHKKYPLLVYIYETLHQGLHRYRHPSPGTSVNPSFYVSNGYVMWMPDIEYGTGYPGRDALKCVLPGIQMLVNKGFIDPKAIGIQGHSWGGYQIAYMVTQTNIFAAVESGAPVSDMVSAYDGIRWGSGMVRQFQYERTQSRLGASLWEVPMRYIENSPIFWADKVQTPIMMMHNDKDGAVPWYQGIEYIMALRRLGKEAYLFNYNGEGHGLRKRINQVDWTKRMFAFFNHYLKGAPAPDWMINGIKAWEKDTQ